MSASERLRTLERDHVLSELRVIPIYRKTGLKDQGADAFSRDRDVESVMDALPKFRALVEVAERRSHWDDAGFLTGLFPHPTPCSYCAALSDLEKALTGGGKEMSDKTDLLVATLNLMFPDSLWNDLSWMDLTRIESALWVAKTKAREEMARRVTEEES